MNIRISVILLSVEKRQTSQNNVLIVRIITKLLELMSH